MPSEESNVSTPPAESQSPEQSENNNFITKIKATLTSWQFRLGAVLAGIVAIFLLVFYWQHLMAVAGLKMWSSHAGARSIDCMIKDTNGDEYISCTALLDGQVVPLECGVSILNLGCRVNYGTASPAIRALKPPKKD